LVDLAPWLVGIGFAILLSVAISTIVFGPYVVWGNRKKKLQSLHKKEAREPGRKVINPDLRDLDG
jgi:formate hydrogenlyase subunit 3/multisubunit Na+/H+ antiporter MnhD subunit